MSLEEPSRYEYVPIQPFKTRKADAIDGLHLQYRLPLRFGAIPPGAAESDQIFLLRSGGVDSAQSIPAKNAYKLRIHVGRTFYDFRFQMTR
jgi:phytoene dehydrogenase-like protein